SPAERSGNVRIDDTHVFPESVTSTSAGDLITGSIKGIVYRARPGESVASAWIRPTPENGLQSVFGVLADERSNTLWLCSVPNPFEPPKDGQASAVMAFDLAIGERKGAYVFPEPRGVCNDITVGPDGSVYAADTPNGRILRLPPG